MNPFRWDVLLVGFLLAVPVLGLGLRGDFTAEEVTARLPWCLVAGWLVVALIRFASAPRTEPDGQPSRVVDPEPAPETDPAVSP